MRLLTSDGNGGFSLTQDFTKDPPRYAILSHTWRLDGGDVTYKDMIDGTAKDKPGYEKIRFCGRQAARNGLLYFWVDSCCIDKSNSTELNEAINSMFRWYRDSHRCFVYLSDVPRPGVECDAEYYHQEWKACFRQSRWFRRGWTLQELLAPSKVEFFSAHGKSLGSKKSLEWHIHDITKIPIPALQGVHLSHFSVEERLLWAEGRETLREEDKFYNLLGIFGVAMPLIYGEGKQNALRRLRYEIDRSSRIASLGYINQDAARSGFENNNATFEVDHNDKEVVAFHSNGYLESIPSRKGPMKSGYAILLKKIYSEYPQISNI
jgi:hypothetical protein